MASPNKIKMNLNRCGMWTLDMLHCYTQLDAGWLQVLSAFPFMHCFWFHYNKSLCHSQLLRCQSQSLRVRVNCSDAAHFQSLPQPLSVLNVNNSQQCFEHCHEHCHNMFVVFAMLLQGHDDMLTFSLVLFWLLELSCQHSCLHGLSFDRGIPSDRHRQFLRCCNCCAQQPLASDSD